MTDDLYSMNPAIITRYGFIDSGFVKTLKYHDFYTGKDDLFGGVCLKKDKHNNKSYVILFHDNTDLSLNVMKVFNGAANIKGVNDIYYSIDLSYETELKNNFEALRNSGKGFEPFSWINITTLPVIVGYKNCIPHSYPIIMSEIVENNVYGKISSAQISTSVDLFLGKKDESFGELLKYRINDSLQRIYDGDILRTDYPNAKGLTLSSLENDIKSSSGEDGKRIRLLIEGSLIKSSDPGAVEIVKGNLISKVNTNKKIGDLI